VRWHSYRQTAGGGDWFHEKAVQSGIKLTPS
jgi:hypothetical protein